MTDITAKTKAEEAAAPYSILYTRNGFVGPASILRKLQYMPDYTHANGDYVPRQFDLHAVDARAFANPRALPVPVLRDAAGLMKIEVAYRRVNMPFAIRNVFADEIHVILSGSATLETDFGILSLEKDDVVCIPRAVTYRIVDVGEELRELIYVSGPRLTLEMAVGFGPLDRLDFPRPWADPSIKVGKYEILLQHGDALTSVYCEYDPLPVMAIEGESAVKKINMNDLGSIDISNCNGLLLPPKMYDDITGNNLFYDLSARKGPRPPIHYNADCDETILYMGGVGHWGSISRPGVLTFVPKGFPHQGAEENVPAGYRAILMETRARLQPSAAGIEISQIMETNGYGLHPVQPQRV